MDLSILYVTMIVVLPGLVLSYVIIDVHDMCLAFGADLRPGPGFSVVQVSPFPVSYTHLTLPTKLEV